MRLLLMLALAVLAGCGQPTAIPLYPVECQLIVSGVPAASAQVAFHPVGEGKLAVGMTGPDGRFHLTTHLNGDGAPAGEYVVTVFWPNHDGPCDDMTHDRLNGAYTDRTKSTLRATIRPETNDLTIQATVTAGGWNLPRRRDVSPERK